MARSNRALLSLAAFCSIATPAAAQQRECNIDAPGRSEQTAEQIILLHDPFTVLCNDGAELRANSGSLNQAVRELYLTGDVYFEDADRILTADEATYNSLQGRLWAQGNVVFVNETEGSTLRGPELEYFRENEERPRAQVLATRRPTLVIEPEDPEAEDAAPLNIVADRVLILGEDELSAFDSVVITRTDLRATSVEARYNSTTEDLELRGEATIVNDDYRLTGEVIQARLTDGSLEHVHARNDARLDGEDMHVAAPDLQLYFVADSLKRAVAVAPADDEGSRAIARSRNFELEAASIDATLVAQQIREVYAVGAARAETLDTAAVESTLEVPGDSLPVVPGLAPPVLGSDWVKGDTVIGYFEPTVAIADSTAEAPTEGGTEADRTEEVELRRLVAIGSAQSLYRMTPEGAAESAPKNVNFLVGARIELDLEDGELSVASAKGLERGVYLEAAAETSPAEIAPLPTSPESPPGLPAEPGVG